MNKKNVITTLEMEVAIARLFGIRRNLIVPNISWGLDLHECDLLIVRKSGYAVEVEIKRTKYDLLNDFKKKHNHIDRKNRIVEFYYAIPEHIYEKCKDFIPKEFGIIVCYQLDFNFIKAEIKRKSKRKKNVNKFTDDEINKVANLGCMRIWKLKEKLNKLQKK